MKILTWPVVAGAALGIVAPLLTYNGNPGNMGFCAACFLRAQLAQSASIKLLRFNISIRNFSIILTAISHRR